MPPMATKVRIVGSKTNGEQDAQSGTRRAKRRSSQIVRQRLARICCCSVISYRTPRRQEPRRPRRPRRTRAARSGTGARDEQRRERLLAVVEAQHGRVVVAAGGGDLVLGVRHPHRCMKFSDARSCGYASATANSRPSAVPSRSFASAAARPGSAHDGGARPRHLVEHLALVRRVALDRLDEVRDEVRAPAQLHVDVRPARLASLRTRTRLLYA